MNSIIFFLLLDLETELESEARLQFASSLIQHNITTVDKFPKQLLGNV